MIKHILWELKRITLSFGEDINICFFNNENVNYRKSYTSCYILKAALIESYSFAKDNQFYLPNV